MGDATMRLNPLVSVCVFAYNHEGYLTEALESVLSQKVGFPFEVIIAEDYSSDGTLHVAQDYQARYPDLIRIEQSGRKDKLLINGHQTGRYNLLNVLHACRGRYIAFLDGDDYWIDSEKLQKQVDFMEAHEGCSLIFHNAYLVRGEGSTARGETYLPAGFARDRDMKQLLVEMNYVQTSSVMFRNNTPQEFPRIFYTCMFGDWPLHVYNLNFGYPEYMHEVMSVYRIGTGIWSRKKRTDQMKGILEFYDQVTGIMPKELLHLIPSAQARNNRITAREYMKEGRPVYYCLHMVMAVCYWLRGKLARRQAGMFEER